MTQGGGGVPQCGTVTGGHRLYFDCPPVRSASTGNGRDLTCWRSEGCRSICVSVGWSASGGGSGRGGGIRGWGDNSTGGRDSGFSVSRINAARSLLRDRKWDRHIRSPCCHVTRGLRTNRARSPQMYCTNHRARSPLLSLSNSIVCGVNGSLREAFGGVGWSLGTSFGGRGGDGGADPVNIIASCKASVAAARAAVPLVDGTGKGTGPTASSPSVSWPEPGTSTSARLACGKSAMAVVKGR